MQFVTKSFYFHLGKGIEQHFKYQIQRPFEAKLGERKFLRLPLMEGFRTVTEMPVNNPEQLCNSISFTFRKDSYISWPRQAST